MATLTLKKKQAVELPATKPKFNRYDLANHNLDIKLTPKAEPLERQMILQNQRGFSAVIGQRYQHQVDAVNFLMMTRTLTTTQATSARRKLHKMIARDIVHGLNL